MVQTTWPCLKNRQLEKSLFQFPVHFIFVPDDETMTRLLQQHDDDDDRTTTSSILQNRVISSLSFFMKEETVAQNANAVLRSVLQLRAGDSHNKDESTSTNDHHYPFEEDNNNNNNNSTSTSTSSMLDKINYSPTTNAVVVGILIAIIIILSVLFLLLIIPPCLRFIQRQIPVSPKRITERYETIEGWLISKVRKIRTRFYILCMLQYIFYIYIYMRTNVLSCLMFFTSHCFVFVKKKITKTESSPARCGL
jgi:hypothetical protein